MRACVCVCVFVCEIQDKKSVKLKSKVASQKEKKIANFSPFFQWRDFGRFRRRELQRNLPGG